MKKLLNKSKSSGFLLERFYTVQQRPDKSAARYEARVLDFAIKNFPRLAFVNKKQVAVSILLYVIANDDIKNKIKLKLVDFQSSEVNWSQAIDMLSLLKAESNAGRLKNFTRSPTRRSSPAEPAARFRESD